MPITPDDQALLNRLSQQYPRISELTPADFQRMSIDRQADQVMQSARNLAEFNQSRLMVPREAELRYRAGLQHPTPIDAPPPKNFQTEDLSQYLTRQPRPATSPPPSIDRPLSRPGGGGDLSQYLTRQPRPSSAAPPPTPNTSGARAAPQTMTAPPPPATPRSPLPNNNPTPGARFSNIPMPAAKLTGVLAIVDFGFRVFQGVPPQKAAVETGGGVVGGVVGGALGGPIGGVVGGLLGGAIGGKIADFIFKESAPKKAETPTQTKVGKVPFNGGQGQGVSYRVRTEFSNPVQFAGNHDLFGPIYGTRVVLNPRDDGLVRGRGEILCHGSVFYGDYSLEPKWVLSSESPNWDTTREYYIESITRNDGKPDTNGNPPPLPIPQDNRLPESLRHPGNKDFAAPSAVPGGAPAPNNYAPGGNVTKDNPSPRGDSPDRVPHGGLKGSLHPDSMRNLLGPPLPAPSPAPAPKKAPEPQDQSYPPPLKQPTPNGDLAPSGAPNPGAGSQFKAPDSITLRFPGPEPVTTTVGGQAIPDAFKPYPVNNPPAPGTGNTPDTDKTTTDNKFQEDLKKRVDELAIGLVGLTTLVKGLQTPVNTIANNTTPAAIGNAVTPAVCKTTEPGGCTTKAINDGVNAGNKDLKDWLKNNGLDAADILQNKDTNTRVRNIENRTGSNRYPMTLPEYLLDDFLDKPVIIQDQVDYNVWALKQWDALIGLFPIKIERTDENGEKQMLKFENIAEAIAELTGLLAEIAFDADTSINVGVHATAEAIGAKVAAIQGNSYLKAISDYLGYQGSHKAIDIPISCTPGAVGIDDKLQENEMENFLKSSTQRAIGWQCTERDDLHSIIKRILFDSEVARAAVYKPLKPPKPGEAQPMTGDAIKADRRKEKDREDDEWEKFKTRIKNQEGTGIDIDLEEKSLTDESP